MYEMISKKLNKSSWCHAMETPSILLALCEGNPLQNAAENGISSRDNPAKTYTGRRVIFVADLPTIFLMG